MEPLWSVIVGIEGIFKGSWGGLGQLQSPELQTPNSKTLNVKPSSLKPKNMAIPETQKSQSQQQKLDPPKQK